MKSNTDRPKEDRFLTSAELENILTELFQVGTSYDPKIHKAPYIDLAAQAIEAYVAQRVIEGRILQLELLKGEYFGVIGEINGDGPLYPLTSNSLLNRIDQIITELKTRVTNNRKAKQ